MKKLVRALVLVLPIILLAACSNKQGNASALVSSADNAVAKQEFNQASAYFDAANQSAKDSKYATAKKDAQFLATAQEKLTQNDFTSAKAALKQISTKNATAAIKSAKKQLTIKRLNIKPSIKSLLQLNLTLKTKNTQWLVLYLPIFSKKIKI